MHLYHSNAKNGQFEAPNQKVLGCHRVRHDPPTLPCENITLEHIYKGMWSPMQLASDQLGYCRIGACTHWYTWVQGIDQNTLLENILLSTLVENYLQIWPVMEISQRMKMCKSLCTCACAHAHTYIHTYQCVNFNKINTDRNPKYVGTTNEGG